MATTKETGIRPALIPEGAAAEYIGLSIAFLRAARCRGTLGSRTPGPPHFKIGRAVRYSLCDLDTWLAARRVVPNGSASH